MSVLTWTLEAAGAPSWLVFFCPHHWTPTTQAEHLATCKGRRCQRGVKERKKKGSVEEVGTG